MAKDEKKEEKKEKVVLSPGSILVEFSNGNKGVYSYDRLRKEVDTGEFLDTVMKTIK